MDDDDEIGTMARAAFHSATVLLTANNDRKLINTSACVDQGAS